MLCRARVLAAPAPRVCRTLADIQARNAGVRKSLSRVVVLRLPGHLRPGLFLWHVLILAWQRVLHFAQNALNLLDDHPVVLAAVHDHLQRISDVVVNVTDSPLALAKEADTLALLMTKKVEQEPGGDSGNTHADEVLYQSTAFRQKATAPLRRSRGSRYRQGDAQ